MKNLNTQSLQILSSSQKTDARGERRSSFGAASFTGAVLVLLLSCGTGVAQTQPDPLTITPTGNVGIGTPAPVNKLSVAGSADFSGTVGIGTNTLGTSRFRLANPNLATDFAHFRFDANGGGEFEFVGWANGWNINSKTAGKNLYLNRDAALISDVLIGRFSLETIVKGNTGNVGIGTTSPANKLSVAGNADFTGNVGIGTAAPANKLSVAGNVDFSGNVGIGTATPTKGKVEIVGSLPTTVGRIAYLTQDSAAVLGNPPVGISNGTTTSLSLHADSVIAASRFYAFSDERLKHVKGRSNKALDLATLMNIEVTDYSYVDSVSKGAGMQKKVTGQQVERVFPQAVVRMTDVVPDIYQKATTKDGWITLTTNLNKGDRVRLISEKQEGIHEVLEVGEGKFRTAFVAPDGPIFVYGREVNDARSVDYQAISMLNVSATQQIKKEKDEEVTALKEENAALRSQLAEQEKRLAAQEQRLSELEAKDKAREERVAALEALLLAGDKHAPRATTLKKVE